MDSKILTGISVLVVLCVVLMSGCTSDEKMVEKPPNSAADTAGAGGLPAGCTSSAGYSSTTGVKCDNKAENTTTNAENASDTSDTNIANESKPPTDETPLQTQTQTPTPETETPPTTDKPIRKFTLVEFIEQHGKYPVGIDVGERIQITGKATFGSGPVDRYVDFQTQEADYPAIIQGTTNQGTKEMREKCLDKWQFPKTCVFLATYVGYEEKDHKSTVITLEDIILA